MPARYVAGKASIVIRSKNEEEWIGHCLEAVFKQDYPSLEVIVVDSGSTDQTLRIAAKYPVKTVVHIDAYLPGSSLNSGIQEGDGEFVVCLSSHCVPKGTQWLTRLLSPFENEAIAGVYGRQLPVSFSSSHDIRDLLITFGLDRRIQEKDSFFHNANSALRRKIWDRVPFDPTVTNIEDRIWAKQVLDLGHKLAYEPDAEVFHHHGLHHGQNQKRAMSTVQVLSSIQDFSVRESLPESMRPENLAFGAVVPLTSHSMAWLQSPEAGVFFADLEHCAYFKKIFILGYEEQRSFLPASDRFVFVERPRSYEDAQISLEDVLFWFVNSVDYVDFHYFVYVSPLYFFRPRDFYEQLVMDVAFKGLDTCFGGIVDFNNAWVFDPEKGYTQIGENLFGRDFKHPSYRALYGLGCVTRPSVLRQRRLVGTKVGIIPLDDLRYSLKSSDPGAAKLVKVLKENL